MTSWAYHMAVKIISWWVHPMHPMHFRSWLKDRQPAGGASFLHTDVVSPVSLSKCRDMRKPFENFPIHPATIILYYFHGLSYNPPMMVRLQSPENPGQVSNVPNAIERHGAWGSHPGTFIRRAVETMQRQSRRFCCDRCWSCWSLMKFDEVCTSYTF